MPDDIHQAAKRAADKILTPGVLSRDKCEELIDAAIREATAELQACIEMIKDRAAHPSLDGTALCDIRDLCNRALSGTAGRDLLNKLERYRRLFGSRSQGPWIVYAGPRSFKVCDSLADALEWATKIDGSKIYERMASDAARQVCMIEDQQAEIERLRKKASAADELFRGIQQIAESGDCGKMLDEHLEVYENTVTAEPARGEEPTHGTTESA